MNFATSTLAALNFAVFACIAAAMLSTGAGDHVWTVALAFLGALTNALAWRKLSNSMAVSAGEKEPEEIAERERLMEDLGEEAERRRERDRIERN